MTDPAAVKQTETVDTPALDSAPPARRGRKFGGVAKAQREAKAVARTMTLENPKVRARLLRECESGDVNPKVFIELLHYGYGCPLKVMRGEGEVRGLFLFITRQPRDYDPLAKAADGAEDAQLTSLPPGSDQER